MPGLFLTISVNFIHNSPFPPPRLANLLAFSARAVYDIYMYKYLRIVFCILSVACVAVTVFIFAYFAWWGLAPLAGAVVFGILMVACKNAQEKQEKAADPPPPAGDFITGRRENGDK